MGDASYRTHAVGCGRLTIRLESAPAVSAELGRRGAARLTHPLRPFHHRRRRDLILLGNRPATVASFPACSLNHECPDLGIPRFQLMLKQTFGLWPCGADPCVPDVDSITSSGQRPSPWLDPAPDTQAPFALPHPIAPTLRERHNAPCRATSLHSPRVPKECPDFS
jgi:hypothetical protein